MELQVNGDKIKVPDSVKTVSSLLNHFDLEKKVVIIELNTEILQKQAHSETILCNGDKIEIVHFVGGG